MVIAPTPRFRAGGWLIGLFFVLFLNVSLARAAGDSLVVGMELAYPPFEMTDAAGKPSGISVDLATDLGNYLGRPVIVENMAFDGLIPALKTGKVDRAACQRRARKGF